MGECPQAPHRRAAPRPPRARLLTLAICGAARLRQLKTLAMS